MLLKGLADGPRVFVYAACSSNGLCQVVETLMDWKEQFPDALYRMAALVYEYTPTKGVPEDKSHFKRLRREIFQFKEAHYADERRKRKQLEALRVACFFETESILICTNAFLKTKSPGLHSGIKFSTPEDAIDEAMRVRYEFHDAKEAGNLSFV